MISLKKWICLSITFFGFYFTGISFSVQPDKNTILHTLKPEHPRLILSQSDISRLQSLVQEDATARQIYAKLKENAEELLNESAVAYIIEGPRLLTQSRLCLDRVYTLSLLYRLDREPKYLQRAVRELRSAAEFPDWNPSHFLDTTEMTHAFAIGYDWLYSDLSDDEKTTIRTALVEKGLKAYLAGKEKNAWWIDSQHNWNQVCHGGIGIGALAIADELPEMASGILTLAVEKMPLALQHYAPDGGWNEGPGYWHYATRYTVYFLASLQTALGTDFELSNFQGMDNAGQFRIDFQSPTGLTFNYADAGSRVGGTEEMFWLAQRYKRPVYAWMQRQELDDPHALDLIWYTKGGGDPASCGLPLDSFYHGINVTFFRSAWNDPCALFVGFKGGDNKANHSHLDLGSFVLDALGERWAVDLGADNYNLPDYFGKKRWTYFRLINESHNTLTLNGENQDPKAEAPIVKFESSQEKVFAIADLSAAYRVKKLQRGITMIDRKSVLVQDELESDKPVDFVWGLMTAAQIEIKDRIATLKIGDKNMEVKILAPDSARFEIVSANPPEPQRQNKGMKRLTIRFDKPQETLTLAVQFTPYRGDTEIPMKHCEVIPLEKWNK